MFAASGTIGAYTGGRLAAHVPDAVLLTGFAVMMAVTAVAMLRPRHGTPADSGGTGRRPHLVLILLQGAVVGGLTGLVVAVRHRQRHAGPAAPRST